MPCHRTANDRREAVSPGDGAEERENRMAIVAGCLILCIWLVGIPLLTGVIPAFFTDGRKHSLAFMWTSGYMISWALFQLVTVPLVLLHISQGFVVVVRLYACCSLALAALGLFMLLRSRKRRVSLTLIRGESSEAWQHRIYWGIFAVLTALQLVLAVGMNYRDGDDAYYVAVSTLTESSNTMYQRMPYSMGNTGLDLRHGLAPFPVWIAFLARISGIPTVSVAHVAVPLALISTTYLIYYQIGRQLFVKKKEKLPLFLCFTAVLTIFGNYSIYTAENFMLARSRQGKAALGSIVIPMILLLFFLILDQVEKGRKGQWMLWLLLCAAVTAACLCTTLGTMLTGLLLGITGVCGGLVYRKPGLVIKTGLCCIPAAVFAVLYFMV